MIALAHSNKGLQPPVGLRIHSTQSLATLCSFFMGVDLWENWAVASWSSPLTVARFYRLDVST